jgi:tetraacyldisaccharide-1-P 4'-kinase
MAPGTAVRKEETGDEAQIFIRRVVAPVGIGKDRWETGKLLHDQYGVDLVVLDDGFQHVRLSRNVDIVLSDAIVIVTR